jgi:hypothetical protein
MRFKKKEHRNLYYLFPTSRKEGRARYFRNLKWSVAIGMIVGGILAVIIYFYNVR